MSFAAHALSRRALRRRHLLGLAAFLTVALWSIGWYVAAYRFNTSVDSWIDGFSKENGFLTFASRSTSGMPWSVDVELTGLQLRFSDTNTLAAGNARARISMLAPYDVLIKLKDGVNGRLVGVPFAADVVKFGIQRSETEPLSEREVGCSLWVHAFGLTSQASEASNRIEEVDAAIRVMGMPPNLTKKEEVKAWSEASGVVEFDRFALRSSDMNLEAKGTVALTADLQLEGAFSGRIDGMDAAIDAVVQKGGLSGKKEALLRSSLAVLARPSGVVGGAPPIVPFSMQDGGLFLGPVRIADIPTLAWP